MHTVVSPSTTAFENEYRTSRTMRQHPSDNDTGIGLHHLEQGRDMGNEGTLSAASEPSLYAMEAAETLPDYLVRYYRWAYLWPSAVWFFDHQPIINAILFGHYRGIMNHTMRLMQPASAGRTLLIAAVYGELVPKLAEAVDELHVTDVAPIQLRAAARKLEAAGRSANLARMNAEYLTYEDNSFDTALMFLLIHEMPPEARRRSLSQAVRVLRRGGRLVIAEYGEVARAHPLHRFAPFRWTLTAAEPFLDGFWNENLTEVLGGCAAAVGKAIEREEQVDIFGGFYRVVSYRVA